MWPHGTVAAAVLLVASIIAAALTASSGALDSSVATIGGELPVGFKTKTTTLVTSEDEAQLVDTGFTRGLHLVFGAVLDSGRQLTTGAAAVSRHD